jgi:hypothetical protein
MSLLSLQMLIMLDANEPDAPFQHILYFTMVFWSLGPARNNLSPPYIPLQVRLQHCPKVPLRLSFYTPFYSPLGFHYRQNLPDTVRHHAVKISWLNEHYLNQNLNMTSTKTSLILADCNTKPLNGSQLFPQISYAIGQRFYPHPSTQHYHDLQLDKYSWNYRQHSLLQKSLHNKSLPFIQR